MVAWRESASLEDLIDNVESSHHEYHSSDEDLTLGRSGEQDAYLVSKTEQNTGKHADR